MAAPTMSFEPLPDVVLQCSGCRTILGDTHEFVCTATIDTAKLMVMAAGSDVRVDRIPQSSAVGGAACTHFPVCCSGCGSVVGRMYTRPPPGMEPLLNAFAMEADRCSSYKLGSADVRVAGSSPAQRPAATPPQPGWQGQQPPQGGANDVLARLEALESDLVKLQAMILLHDQQLTTLPRYPGSGGAEDPGGGGGGGAGQGSLPYPAAPLALGNM